ncbi:MAG: glycosyltransferase, partial [Clostridia bacterium]|nr:glycosyltransferase [Clostridia bacterium]
MKFLLLLSSLDRGGAETHLVTLATALSRRGHSVTVISSGGSLVDALDKENIEHRALPLHSRSPLAWLHCYVSLRRELSKRRYDLIHAHSRIPAFLISGLAKSKKIPFVTTVHASFRVTPLFRRFSRWGDISIAVSEDLKQYLCENYDCSAERIEVIPNGIDTSYFSPASNEPCLPTRRLLYVSRLDEDCSAVAFLLCRHAQKLKEKFLDLQ